MFVFILTISLSFSLINGDINMHSPRGSNNRLNEASRGRANGNRLFDSQNNNRGGHNVGEQPGEEKFFSGSKFHMQWANQHSCNDENNNCDVIIQYMCDEDLKDGTTRSTPPLNRTNCADSDCDTDPRFGHHESYQSYQECLGRSRNKHLFTSIFRLRFHSARSTRQNRNGNRRGYECPEERDYYPYWHPTPWRDIAVLTNNVERCDYYKQNSQNVKSRFFCRLPDEYWEQIEVATQIDTLLPLTEQQCNNYKVIGEDGIIYMGQWTEAPSHGIAPPDCRQSIWTRDNHQGNTYGGEFPTYIWTVPEVATEQRCIVRMRYNISTEDFPAWETDATDNPNTQKFTAYPAYVYERFGMPEVDAARRQYYLKQDPDVDVFNLSFGKDRGTDVFRLAIALDPAQYGRTFQDRSHVFRIAPAPAEAAGKTIHNINVRGKRGNIVETYPSVEYDFVPNNLSIPLGDLIHFQWTGSDNNPGGNDGQGRARTDRSNVIQLNEAYKTGVYYSTNYPDKDGFLGLTSDEIESLAFLQVDGTNDRDLNDKKAYYSSGLLSPSALGTFYYMSSRNNAFSNRDQKGLVTVV